MRLDEAKKFLKHEEAAAIVEVEQRLIKSGISKELIIFLKRSIILRKYLHLVFKRTARKNT